MARKRSRIEIINDMLLAIQGKGGRMKPTHLMYKSNLSHALLKSYLEELIDKELVIEAEEKKKRVIEITTKGDQFVEKFLQMKEFEESFGL